MARRSVRKRARGAPATAPTPLAVVGVCVGVPLALWLVFDLLQALAFGLLVLGAAFAGFWLLRRRP